MNEQQPITRGQRIALSVPLALMLIALVAPPHHTLLRLFYGWGSDWHAGVHRVHDVVMGAGALMLAAALVLALVRPERSVSALRQIIVISAAFVVAAAVAQAVWPPVFIYPVLAAIAVALHPRRADIVRLNRAPSIPLLAFVALAAIPLTWFALDEAALQRSASVDIHGEEYHWAGMTVFGIALIMTGLVASLRGTGWRVSAWSAAAAAAVFGAVSIAYPDHASNIGTGWGIAAIAGGMAFIAISEMEGLRSARVPEGRRDTVTAQEV
jgi:hypothetical protein